MRLAIITASALIVIARVVAAPIRSSEPNQITTVPDVSSGPRLPYNYRPGTTWQYRADLVPYRYVQKRDVHDPNDPDCDPHAGDPRYAGTWMSGGTRWRHHFSPTGYVDPSLSFLMNLPGFLSQLTEELKTNRGDDILMHASGNTVEPCPDLSKPQPGEPGYTPPPHEGDHTPEFQKFVPPAPSTS
jgi:hypothetical protein